MRSKQEDTPPPSPGVGEDDELYEDEIAEEIDVIEGEAEVQYFIPIILASVTLVERILLSPPQGSAIRSIRLLLHLQSPGLGVHEDQLKF